MKRGRVVAAIGVVALTASAAAFMWFRSRPHWVLRGGVSSAALTPNGELVLATTDTIARVSASGATTTIAKAHDGRALVASGTHAFWVEHHLLGPSHVRGVALAGGAPSDLGETTPNVLMLAASNDCVFALKETGDVTSGDQDVAHDAHCIAADDTGAFAATASGVLRLDTGAIVFPREVTARCALLLSASEVFLATWTGPASTLERAPRAGGPFERARTEPNVAAWYLASAKLAWTSVESLGKDRQGYERTEVLTHIARGSDPSSVVATGDTAWIGASGDTLYLLEPDGVRALTSR